MPKFIGIDSKFGGPGQSSEFGPGLRFVQKPAIARLIPHSQEWCQVGEVEARAAENRGTQGTGN
jgi:hypothetical protein